MTRWHAHPKAGNHPAGDVQLRSASGENYMLVEEKTGRVLETIGEEHAFANAHEGAVYLHRGDQFLISELNLQTKIATLQTTNVDYYTVSMADTDMTVLETQQTKQQGTVNASVGPVDVTRTVYAFNRRRHDRPELLVTRLPGSAPSRLYDRRPVVDGAHRDDRGAPDRL